MSFTALLLPLLPHLTHYQYLAEKKNLSTGFRPLPTLHPWLFCGNPTQTESPTMTPRARRAGAPAFRAPPRTPALRPAHWRPTILGSTHVPGSGLRALPPFFPSVLALRGCRAEPRAGGTHTHLGRTGPGWALRPALRGQLSTNAPGLFPAASPARLGGAARGGTARSPESPPRSPRGSCQVSRGAAPRRSLPRRRPWAARQSAAAASGLRQAAAPAVVPPLRPRPLPRRCSPEVQVWPYPGQRGALGPSAPAGCRPGIREGSQDTAAPPSGAPARSWRGPSLPPSPGGAALTTFSGQPAPGREQRGPRLVRALPPPR